VARAPKIVGCIKGYSWCKLKHVDRDVWIASSRLEFVYQGRRSRKRVLLAEQVLRADRANGA